MFSARFIKLGATGAAAIAIAIGAYGIVGATAGNGPATTTTSTSAAATGRPAFGGRGSNARSGPAAGGATGTVSSLSKSSFVLSTSAGQTVTVDNASSTTYRNGARSIPASAITNGVSVLVLGTVDGATIVARQVIVQPAGSAGASGSATKVVPFQRGAASTSRQVGQIPANYSQGSGTIVGGTTADKATQAALAAYPGGIVNRVVQLSSGEYEVHNIGVNWPHHIFVNQDFKVVGAG
jgi:hypothetical protein